LYFSTIKNIFIDGKRGFLVKNMSGRTVLITVVYKNTKLQKYKNTKIKPAEGMCVQINK